MFADAGQPSREFRASGLAEVVALVVAIATAYGPAVGVQQDQGVLLVRLQRDPCLPVEPQHRADDLFEVAQEPLGGHGSPGAAGPGGETGDDLGEPGPPGRAIGVRPARDQTVRVQTVLVRAAGLRVTSGDSRAGLGTRRDQTGDARGVARQEERVVPDHHVETLYGVAVRRIDGEPSRVADDVECGVGRLPFRGQTRT